MTEQPKTLAAWESSGLAFTDYAREGDEVDEATADYFLGNQPPELFTGRLILAGEPMDHRGPAGAARFMCFVQKDGRWTYAGLKTLPEAVALSTWSWADLKREVEPLLKDLEPDYVSVGLDLPDSEAVWNETTHTRWIACYPVEGGSEGWFLHIDQIAHERRQTGLLAKFWSQEEAIEAAARVARVVLPRAWG
jgi:hypothetical protein